LNWNITIPAGGLAPVTQSGVDRMCHRHVGDQTGAKKTLFSRKRPIYELIDNHKGPWRQIVTKRTNG
jgi:hypothetical protein